MSETATMEAPEMEAQTEEKPARKPRKVKPAFEGGARNEEGLLTESPANAEGYVHGNFARLKIADFATEDVYLDYRADILAQKAADTQAASDDMRAQAEQYRQFGGSDVAKKQRKLARLQSMLESLQAELAEAGIEA